MPAHATHVFSDVDIKKYLKVVRWVFNRERLPDKLQVQGVAPEEGDSVAVTVTDTSLALWWLLSDVFVIVLDEGTHVVPAEHTYRQYEFDSVEGKDNAVRELARQLSALKWEHKKKLKGAAVSPAAKAAAQAALVNASWACATRLCLDSCSAACGVADAWLRRLNIAADDGAVKPAFAARLGRTDGGPSAEPGEYPNQHAASIGTNFRTVDLFPSSAGTRLGVLSTLVAMLDGARFGRLIDAGHFLVIGGDIGVTNIIFQLVHSQTPWENSSILAEEVSASIHADDSSAERQDLIRLLKEHMNLSENRDIDKDKPLTQRGLADHMTSALCDANMLEETQSISEKTVSSFMRDHYRCDGPFIRHVRRFLVLKGSLESDGAEEGEEGGGAARKGAWRDAVTVSCLQRVRAILRDRVIVDMDTFHPGSTRLFALPPTPPKPDAACRSCTSPRRRAPAPSPRRWDQPRVSAAARRAVF